MALAMPRLRTRVGALALAAAAWGGCAAHKPLVDPSFADRSYTPIRIAVLPPDVFMIYDQIGDDDPVRSAALGQTVSRQFTDAVAAALASRGYATDLRARWDGIGDGAGNLLVGRDELGALANSILAFANSGQGGGQGRMRQPAWVAPDLTAHVGWATQSDALLYVNMKGVVTSDGKRAAQVAGTVLFILLIVLIIVLATQSRDGGGGHAGSAKAGGASHAIASATKPRGAAGAMPAPHAPGQARWVPPSGYGHAPRGGGGHYGGSNFGLGVGVIVPLDDQHYTHEGQVEPNDEYYNGDEVYISMTLVSAQDGRVLWHTREEVDIDADEPRDLEQLARRLIGSMPLRGDLPEPARK